MADHRDAAVAPDPLLFRTEPPQTQSTSSGQRESSGTDRKRSVRNSEAIRASCPTRSVKASPDLASAEGWAADSARDWLRSKGDPVPQPQRARRAKTRRRRFMRISGSTVMHSWTCSLQTNGERPTCGSLTSGQSGPGRSSVPHDSAKRFRQRYAIQRSAHPRACATPECRCTGTREAGTASPCPFLTMPSLSTFEQAWSRRSRSPWHQPPGPGSAMVTCSVSAAEMEMPIDSRPWRPMTRLRQCSGPGHRRTTTRSSTCTMAPPGPRPRTRMIASPGASNFSVTSRGNARRSRVQTVPSGATIS